MKKKTIISVVSLCLAALLLCGGICLATANYVDGRLRDIADAGMAQQALDPLSVSTPALAPEIATLALKAQSGTEMAATEIYELACSQVVGISTEVNSTNIFGQAVTGSVTGTGFLISGDGYILTNNHVVEEAYKSNLQLKVILHDGSEHDAKIIGVEPDNDIAVVKIEAKGMNAAALGSSEQMKVGESIYVVGNPLGELTYTMTGGMVSALDREITVDQSTTVNMFQLDAAVNSGNSGGPVYNSRGQVVGVVTAKYKSTGVEGLSFAIPVDDAAAIAKELIAHGYVSGKPALGINAKTMTQQYASYYNTVVGVLVYSVNPGSCAEKAGLAQGDVITKMAGREVLSMADLSAIKKDYKAGDTVTVTVYRSGKYLDVQITFDEMKPENSVAPQTPPQPSATPAPEQEAPFSQIIPGPGEAPEDDPKPSPLEEYFRSFINRFFGGSIIEKDDEGGQDPDQDWWHFGG